MDFIALLIAFALGAAPGAAAPAQKPVTEVKSGKTVKVSPSRYGDILVDGKGRTLYLFTKERSPKVRCYGDCARAVAAAHHEAQAARRQGRRCEPRRLQQAQGRQAPGDLQRAPGLLLRRGSQGRPDH